MRANDLIQYLRISLLLSLVLPAIASASVEEYNFRAWIDERVVGQHSFSIHENGSVTEVESNARFAVKILFVKLFDYEHSARETWEKGCLTDLVAFTTTNGKETSVTDEEALADSPPNYCPATFAYWDLSKLARETLLNPQTGQLMPVELKALENAPVPRTDTMGRRYELTTPMGEISLWYNANNEWLALQSNIEGRILTYVSEALLTSGQT